MKKKIVVIFPCEKNITLGNVARTYVQHDGYRYKNMTVDTSSPTLESDPKIKKSLVNLTPIIDKI